MKNVKDYLKDESGQTSTEYILLIAVVAGVVFKLKGALDMNLTRIIKKVFDIANGKLDSDGDF
jgi:pilus assembly protein Flp/PilA